MTWNELRLLIERMDPARMSDTVTIYDPAEDEFFPAREFELAVDDSVLDPGHYVLIMDT